MNRALQSQLSQSANQGVLDIRQAEINYHMNLNTAMGTQAALVGAAMYGTFLQNSVNKSSQFIEFYLGVYFVITAVTIALAVHVILTTMLIQILGPGLALHGPIGSMTRSTAGMRAEQRQIVTAFIVMMVGFGFSTVSAFWTVMNFYTALVSSLAFAFVARYWFYYCERIYLRFYWENTEDIWNDRASDMESMDPAQNPLHRSNGGPGAADSSSKPHNNRPTGRGLYKFLFTFGKSKQQLREERASEIANERGDLESHLDGSSITAVELKKKKLDGATTSAATTGTIAGKHVSFTRNVTMEGFLTFRTVTPGSHTKQPWERRYFVLNSHAQLYQYKSRQDYRTDPKSPLYTRPLELGDYYIKVENIDMELRSELEAESALSDDAASVTNSASSSYGKDGRMMPFRFQMTLIPKDNDLVDERHNKATAILRCDTEEQLQVWTDAMRALCSGSFTD